MNSETVLSALPHGAGASVHGKGNYRRTFADYLALDRALAVDDLKAARAAFARLQEDSPPIAEAVSSHPFPHDNFHLRALKELGRALMTGDLRRAKHAFHRFQ